MRVAAAITIAGVALAAGSPAAGADVTSVSERFAARYGPVLAGEELVWVRQPDRRHLSVRAGSGRSSRELLGAEGARRKSELRAWLSASDTHVGVELLDVVWPPERSGAPPPLWSRSVLAGPVAGPLSPLGEGCDDALEDPRARRGISVGGARAAFAGPGCGTRSVADLSTGTQVALPDTAVETRIDGDWVAWEEQEGDRYRVVARNLATGQEYRTPANGLDAPPRDFDVDTDGGLAIVPARTLGGLRFASPSQPEARALDLGGRREITRVRLEDGIVAALASDRGTQQWLTAGYVLVGDPDSGPLRRHGGGFDAAELVDGAFDFDGSRVAVQVRRCGRVQLLHAGSVAELPEARHAARCRLRLRERPHVEGRRLIVPISCAGYTWDCGAESLRAVTAGRSKVLVARRSFTNRAGRAWLYLTPQGRRLARRGELGRVRISARINERTILGSRPHRVSTRVAR